MKADTPKPGWLVAGSSAVVLIILALILYRQTTRDVMDAWGQWETGEFAHGYLVLAMSLFMVYARRRILSKLAPCPSFPALLAVIICSLLWLVATLVDVQMVQSAALLGLVMSIIWAALGTAVARHLLLPVMFIGVAMPVWSPLAPLLQDLTADVVFQLTRIADVPALRQEHLIILPAGTLSIEKSCAGMRYLLAALVLGILYGDLYYSGFLARIVVLAVTATAAIMANIVRVFIVVWLANKTAMQHPWVTDHLALGWFLFGGLVFILLAIDIGLARHARHPHATGQSFPDPPARQACGHSLTGYVLAMLGIGVLAASGPALAWWTAARPQSMPEVVLEFPPAAGGWSGPDATLDSWMPVYHGATAGKRVYRKADTELFLYIGRYTVQSQGSELINDLNGIGNREWRTLYSRGRVTNHAGSPVLEQVLLSPAGQKRLAWYWYQVAGRKTTSEYMAKLLQVIGRLTDRPEAAVVVLVTPIENDAATAQGVLADFLLATGDSVSRAADGR